jgi:DNA polymerase V
MNGDSMEGSGIFSGTVLIVDRSITSVTGKVIVALLNAGMLVRCLFDIHKFWGEPRFF